MGKLPALLAVTCLICWRTSVVVSLTQCMGRSRISIIADGKNKNAVGPLKLIAVSDLLQPPADYPLGCLEILSVFGLLAFFRWNCLLSRQLWSRAAAAVTAARKRPKHPGCVELYLDCKLQKRKKAGWTVRNSAAAARLAWGTTATAGPCKAVRVGGGWLGGVQIAQFVS